MAARRTSPVAVIVRGLVILALAACLAPVAAQSAQQRQGDRALPTPQDDVTSDEAAEGSHAASSTGSRRKPQLSMAWREDAAWLWTQVGAVVENPVASPRDVATAALGAAGMGLDVGSKNPDPVIGVRGDTLLRAQRPHATAPLLVIRDFLTRRESDKLVLATNQAASTSLDEPDWCLSPSVRQAVRKAGLSEHETGVYDAAATGHSFGDAVCLQGSAVNALVAPRLPLHSTCVLASDGANPTADRAAGWLHHAAALSGLHAGSTQLWRSEHGFAEEAALGAAPRTACDAVHENGAMGAKVVGGGGDNATTAVVLVVFLSGDEHDNAGVLRFPHLGVDIAAKRGTAVLWSPLHVPGWPTPVVGEGGLPEVLAGTCNPAMATVQSGTTPLPVVPPGTGGTAQPVFAMRRVYSSEPATSIPGPVSEHVVCLDAGTCAQYVLEPGERTSQELIRDADAEVIVARQNAYVSTAGTRRTGAPAEDSLATMEKLLAKYVAAMEASPGSVRATAMVAYQLGRTGRLQQSARLWRRVAGRLPYSVRVRTALASVEVALGNLDVANKHLATARLLDPSDVDVIMQKAVIAERQGAIEAAAALVAHADTVARASNVPKSMGRIRHELRRLRLLMGFSEAESLVPRGGVQQRPKDPRDESAVASASASAQAVHDPQPPTGSIKGRA